MNLTGRGVLITGGSRGIGAALASSFASRGARLFLVGRSELDLAKVSASLKATAAFCQTFCADIAREDERDALVVEARRALGEVDILINNAGVGLYGLVEDLTSEQLQVVNELNLVAPAHLCSLLLPGMRERRSGAIVMVSSVLGARAIPYSGGYCASKFALEGLSQSLRAELVHSGVNLLVVRPGRTETGFRNAAMTEGYRPSDTLPAMSAADVASATVRALENGRETLNFTIAGRMMMAAQRVSPRFVDFLMSRLTLKMQGS